MYIYSQFSVPDDHHTSDRSLDTGRGAKAEEILRAHEHIARRCAIFGAAFGAVLLCWAEPQRRVDNKLAD